jgi:NAD(P)-dependent dehydrogenase (short-subunit alcohol dehydrogenase family)
MTDKPGTEQRVALVTGASRGIGRAVAVALARTGTHVVITGRVRGALEETDDLIRAAGGSASLLPLDLADGAAVDSLGPSLFARFGRLDVLVSNAGVLGALMPVAHITPQVWTDAITVNVTTQWRLIRTCAPLLLASPAGRAVFVTSRIARTPTAYWGAYGASKAALEHLALTWAAEVQTTRLRVNLFDPGPVATGMRAVAFPGENPAILPQPADVAPLLVTLCDPAETRQGAIVRYAVPEAATA